MVMDKPSSLSILAEHLESVIERMGDDSRASMWIQLLTKEDRQRLAKKLAREAAEVVLGRVSMKISMIENDELSGACPVIPATDVMNEVLKDWEA